MMLQYFLTRLGCLSRCEFAQSTQCRYHRHQLVFIFQKTAVNLKVVQCYVWSVMLYSHVSQSLIDDDPICNFQFFATLCSQFEQKSYRLLSREQNFGRPAICIEIIYYHLVPELSYYMASYTQVQKLSFTPSFSNNKS